MVTLVISTESPRVYGPPQGRWTFSDWEKLPDDGNRYEIINGVVYMSTAPSFFHQWIVAQLHRLLGAPAQEMAVAYSVSAPIGVIMPGCEPVQPDFVVIRRENADIIQNRRILGVPDLIVEIISPGSRAYDEDIKLETYAQAGVPEYAVIDPASRSLKLYKLEGPGRYAAPQEFTATQSMTFTCLPGISLEIGKLFEGAPDTTL